MVARHALVNKWICTPYSSTRAHTNTHSSILSCCGTHNLFEGYEAPRKRGVGQFGLVKTSEQTLVDCPVMGVPGPAMFYWERGEDLFNMTGYVAVVSPS